MMQEGNNACAAEVIPSDSNQIAARVKAGALFIEGRSRMTLGTRLFTWLRGRQVGTDGEGNRYFEDRKPPAGRRRRRWVLYNGEAEASRVPPDWHGWLHYTTDATPPPGGLPRQSWQKDHVRNLSGTADAYRPPGHSSSVGGEKPKPPYEAWRPGS